MIIILFDNTDCRLKNKNIHGTLGKLKIQKENQRKVEHERRAKIKEDYMKCLYFSTKIKTIIVLLPFKLNISAAEENKYSLINGCRRKGQLCWKVRVEMTLALLLW